MGGKERLRKRKNSFFLPDPVYLTARKGQAVEEGKGRGLKEVLDPPEEWHMEAQEGMEKEMRMSSIYLTTFHLWGGGGRGECPQLLPFGWKHWAGGREGLVRRVWGWCL